MNKSDTFASLLRSKGLRATDQRLTLLKLLAKASKPMSIAELEQRFPEADLDRVTFYRGLESLAAVGIVRKVNLRHEHADYELALDHHHHLVCESCEKIEEIDWCPAPTLSTATVRKHGFSTVRDHAIEFFGLCTSCA